MSIHSAEDPALPRRQWVAVASAEHVRYGRTQGFMQLCHGKRAPLLRIRPGDQIVYYSPTVTFGGTDRLQAFTAIGTVRAGKPYLVEMDGGFRPYRRDVEWTIATEAPIKPLLGTLGFTAGRTNWGYSFRFGVFSIDAHDFGVIAEAMGATAMLAQASLPSVLRSMPALPSPSCASTAA